MSGTDEAWVIPDLLLDLAGAIVTLDVAGCQVGNAGLMQERDGHCLLARKGNQPKLHAAVWAVYDRACGADSDFTGVRSDRNAKAGDGHGGDEERYAIVIYHQVWLPADWAVGRGWPRWC